MHARSGGDIEIMGLMQGKVLGDTLYVMDAFALPVEGTETRVNAQAEGYEYMVDYMMLIKKVVSQSPRLVARKEAGRGRPCVYRIMYLL